MKVLSSIATLSVLLTFILAGCGYNAQSPTQNNNEAKDAGASGDIIDPCSILGSGSGAKEGETVFLACPGKKKDIFGPLSVTFGAQIVRPDGKDYEAVVIFGDGEETNVAHWSPTLFNEEIEHTYAQPGEYEASLVLVPKESLDADVMKRIKKVQDLDNLILIKKISVKV